MIIKLLYFENDIEIQEEKVSVLEIENKKMYSKFIFSIYNKINGIDIDNEIYLFENGKELKFSDSAFYISDPMMIDFNDKIFINAVTKEIINYLNVDIESKNLFEKKYSELYFIFQNIISDFTINFSDSSNLDVGKYLKMIGLKIDDTVNATHLDKVLSIIEIISELRIFRFIIFSNLKSYLSTEQVEEVYKFALYKKIPLVLFESTLDKRIILNEKKITIDRDYEEFVKIN